jgi:hypothetical protein
VATATPRDLTGAVFRANPRYRLRAFEDLTADQHKLVAAYHGSSGMFGVLVPTAPGNQSIKSVCPATARLFESLASPGKLPGQLSLQSEPHLNEELAALVLDEVLEIARDGDFVSGAAAFGVVLCPQGGSPSTGKLAELSLEALKYACALQFSDVSAVAARLYFYNRLPVTAHWESLWPDEAAVRRYLGVGDSGVLARDFRAAATADSPGGWLTWTSRDTQSVRPDCDLDYKLYISPRPEHVGEAFSAILPLAAGGSCRTFKIGCDVFGLLRPDKLVCYFSTFDDLAGFAAIAERNLAGCPPHGVPFSASLTADGLLSWGMDPPVEQERPDWLEPESWRLWVCNRLARSLSDAGQNGHPGIEPWQFALERMRLAGVDVDTWAPADVAWRRTNVRTGDSWP